MRKEIYMHFQPDERLFIDRALEWITKVEQFHEVKRTDFLDPRQQYILQTLVNRNPDLQLRLDGGYLEAERKRAWIAYDYVDLTEEEPGIEVLSITSDDVKYHSLDHGDYLGAILGLGIKRDKVGDLQVLDHGCHALVTSEMIHYLHLHLNQVHRVHVQTEIFPVDRLQIADKALAEMKLVTSSLRLDAILSDVVRISRSKVIAPIKAGKCRVNWKVEVDPSTPLDEGDVVSLHGYGRFQVLAIDGVTKKQKMRVTIGKFI